MLEWILNNKDWLFSGIGVSIISVLFIMFKKKGGQNINSGNNSTNIQGGDDMNINFGDKKNE